MNDLIKVNYKREDPTVSANELYSVLEVKTNFKDWFPRMCEYGFNQGIDFNPLKIEQVQIEGLREVKRSLTDYEVTITMAKEICMLQRSEKGNLKPYSNKNKDLFELKESKNNKTGWVGVQTLITLKGRETFRLLLLGNK